MAHAAQQPIARSTNLCSVRAAAWRANRSASTPLLVGFVVVDLVDLVVVVAAAAASAAATAAAAAAAPP